MSLMRGMVEWLGTTLVAAVVILAVLAVVGPGLGWNAHPVLSGSMEPTLGVGGIIVTNAVRLEEVQVGDIVTFRSGDSLVTHRVVEIVHKEGGDKPWFRTKGDANSEPDGEVISSKADRVARTALYVPHAGYLALMGENRSALPLLLVVPAVCLIGLLSREVWNGIKEERAKRRRDQNGNATTA